MPSTVSGPRCCTLKSASLECCAIVMSWRLVERRASERCDSGIVWVPLGVTMYPSLPVMITVICPIGVVSS